MPNQPRLVLGKAVPWYQGLVNFVAQILGSLLGAGLLCVTWLRLVFSLNSTAAERTARKARIPTSIPPFRTSSPKTFSFSFFVFFPGQIVPYVAVDGCSNWINAMFSFQIPGKPR